MEYLIRFAQVHESFRIPEIEALAARVRVEVEVVFYSEHSPFCIVKAPDESAARSLIANSILVCEIYELWGQGATYEELHENVRSRTEHLWSTFRDVSFRFAVDTFGFKYDEPTKRDIIESFDYVGFEGPIRLRDAKELFTILEERPSWKDTDQRHVARRATIFDQSEDRKIYFGRWLSRGSRELINKYSLKTRKYISTTSMDAELSFITANMALAAPGKLFFDPFVGTGSFSVAAAHFGALTLGSDIDPRSFKGKDDPLGNPTGIKANFRQYGIESKFWDVFTADLTNTPLRKTPFLDGIICDPPYGIREGLRVLGTRDGIPQPVVAIDGVPTYIRRRPGWIPPKKPYGFEAMLRDILEFAVCSLVERGRLAMWMPTANDADIELPIPMHPRLEVVSISVQAFGHWSRRLLVYSKLPEGQVIEVTPREKEDTPNGVNADDLNEFRRKYFMRKRPLNPKEDCHILPTDTKER